MPVTSFDLGALSAAAAPDVRWPLSMATIDALNRQFRETLVSMIGTQRDPEFQDVLQIGAPAIMITLLTEGVIIALLSSARNQDLSFVFSSGSLAQDLQSGHATHSGRVYDLIAKRFEDADIVTPRTYMRDFAHGVITNRNLSLRRDTTLIVNHNILLQKMARDSAQQFYYRSPGRIFDRRVRTKLSPTIKSACKEFAHELVGRFSSILRSIDAIPLAKHTSKLAESTANWLLKVAHHRELLDLGWRRRPGEIWTGTGGNYVTRQIRAAVKRAGGKVTGFEHGGGGHIHRELGSEIINEFWLCDRFVADTQAKGDIYRAGMRGSGLELEGGPVFQGAGPGLATFKWDNANENTRPARTILYVTTAFVGETCYPIQPLLPDVIYADWQGRLADSLVEQGFEVLIKQHPQGVRRGEPFVTSGKAQYIGGRFEDAIKLADAFVFDYPATTSLWEAICTRKPVLFVDIGLANWNEKVRAHFERRCAILTATFDEWNRPQADFSAIRCALDNAPMSDTFAEEYLTGTPRS